MLRRFEMYSIREDAPRQAVDHLYTAMRECGRFIPEVQHSVVGRNESAVGLDLVWEHAYESPEAYQRYMVHPFHATVLDRFLLGDCAERVTTDSRLGAGLVGYTCDDAVFHPAAGARRVVLLALGAEVAAETVAALTADAWNAVDTTDGLVATIVAENSFASRWFDGVTPITAPSKWSYVWEQAFSSMDALRAYRAAHPTPADALPNAACFIGEYLEVFYATDAAQPA
jgi:hypothetical protein